MRTVLPLATALLALALLTTACSRGEPSIRANDAEEAAPSADPAAAVDASNEQVGERARYEVSGDIVRVNNELCGVSRTRMGPETLGKFVSRVTYSGPNEEFQGKTLLFNQCCAMCLDRFPKRWADDPDEILAFHGLVGQPAKSP